MDQECDSFGSLKALALAKRNVEKYYAVVGVLEKMQESLEVLENYVPAFFKNAHNMYQKMLKDTHINRNKQKPKVPQYVKNLLRSNFTLEIEFFEFCKQRLFKQYLAVK